MKPPLDAKLPVPPSSFEMAEKISKAAALLVAVSYGLGVLISNEYLIALGVSDFASLRPKYIITGLWTIVLIVLAALPILLPMAAITSFPKRKKLALSTTYFVIAVAFLVGIEPILFHWLGS